MSSSKALGGSATGADAGVYGRKSQKESGNQGLREDWVNHHPKNPTASPSAQLIWKPDSCYPEIDVISVQPQMVNGILTKPRDFPNAAEELVGC